MVHGKKRIPYWIDRRLTGLAGPEYHAIISFRSPIEPEDSQYGESRYTCGFNWESAEFRERGRSRPRLLQGEGPTLNHFAFAIVVVLSIACQQAASEDDPAPLPPAVQVLSSEYQEAFRLLPDGKWARQFYALEFAEFDLDEWSKLDDTPPVAPFSKNELGSAEEFNLMRVLGDEDAHEWVVEKVRELDMPSGEKFAAAESPRDRLEVLRQMVTTTGIEPSVLDAELYFRWVLGVTTESGKDEIDLAVARQRQVSDTSRELWRLSPKGRIARITELRVCEWLVWDVVGADDTLDVVANGQCDVGKVIELSQRALRADSGKTVPTEAEYRERIDAGERLKESNPAEIIHRNLSE